MGWEPHAHVSRAEPVDQDPWSNWGASWPGSGREHSLQPGRRRVRGGRRCQLLSHRGREQDWSGRRDPEPHVPCALPSSSGLLFHGLHAAWHPGAAREASWGLARGPTESVPNYTLPNCSHGMCSHCRQSLHLLRVQMLFAPVKTHLQNKQALFCPMDFGSSHYPTSAPGRDASPPMSTPNRRGSRQASLCSGVRRASHLAVQFLTPEGELRVVSQALG